MLSIGYIQLQTLTSMDKCEICMYRKNYESLIIFIAVYAK